MRADQRPGADLLGPQAPASLPLPASLYTRIHPRAAQPWRPADHLGKLESTLHQQGLLVAQLGPTLDPIVSDSEGRSGAPNLLCF